MYKAIIHAAMIAAMASDAGIAAHTPSMPNICGRTMRSGSRNSSLKEAMNNVKERLEW